MSDPEKFDQWCIVDLFGHQRLAGRVTEQTIGGCNFVRVDVPQVGERQGFTRFFTQGAIYGITPVSEELAKRAAGAFRAEPVTPYELPAAPRLSAPRGSVDGDHEEQF